MNQSVLKRDGMLTAASADRYHLERARHVAHHIGRERGFCCVDDVRSALKDLPSGNYLGSLFKDGSWRIHSYQKSNHEGSHARLISVWEYIGEKIGPAGSTGRHALPPAAVRPAPTSFVVQGEMFEDVADFSKFKTACGF